jgi:phosphoenolpyruvate carboxykinase (ATP)
VPNVPPEILIPEQTWKSSSAFQATANKLAKLFVDNFKKFEAGATTEVKAAGPTPNND